MGIILKRLEVENYKQHSRKDIDFVGHIIGVVGENGAGKSNLLGALHFALSGEQPGFKRTDLLKWGTKKGYVALDFEYDGKPGRVVRKLQSNSAEFEFGDIKVSGTAKVAEAMTEALDLDKDLLRQTVFVRQSEIEAVLFEDPAVRALGFQKLCGIGDANKIHKKMGEILGSVPPPTDYDTRIIGVEADIERLKAQKLDLESKSAAVEATLSNSPDSDTLRKSSAVAASAASDCDRWLRIEADVGAKSAAIDSKRAELALLPPEPETDDSEAVAAEIGVLEDKLSVLAQFQRVKAEYERAVSELNALGPRPTPTAGLATKYTEAVELAETLQKRFLPAKSNMDGFARLKQVLGSDVSAGVPCPVCDTVIGDAAVLDRKIAEAEAEIKDSDPSQIMAARDALKLDIDAEARALANWDSKSEVLKARADTTATAVSAAATAVETHPESGDADTCSNRIREIKAELQAKEIKRRQRLGLVAEISGTDSALQSLRAEVEAAKTAVTDAATYFKMGAPDPASVPALKQQLLEMGAACEDYAKTSAELSRQSAEFKGMLSGLDGQLKQATVAVAGLESEKKTSESRNKAMKVLAAVRQWFHYGNGPQTLVKSVLEDMNADVNAFLEKFGSSFQVLTNPETMGFLYRNLDGSPMPNDVGADTSHLSGGQKIQLALAFRFAAYCMFAGKLGILSLDEPTVYLDERHVGLFCGLLEQIKTVAEKMGLQVLLATHERAVMPFLDTVVEV